MTDQKLNEETLKQVEQKIKEMSVQKEEDHQIQQINEQYKLLLSSISDELPIETIKQIATKLVEISTLIECSDYIQKKNLKFDQFEKEEKFREQTSLLERKNKHEVNCRELQKQIAFQSEQIDKIPELEKQNRDNMKEKFYKDLAQTNERIVSDEEAFVVLSKEFEELNQVREQKIKDYEQKEKEFWAKVKENEEQQKSDSEKYLKKFEQIQADVQKCLQERVQLDAQQKQISDKKMKLHVYQGKQKEYVETLEKSTSTIGQLKTEFLRQAFTMVEAEQKAKSSESRAEIVNQLTIQLVTANKSLSEEMAQIEKEKEQIRNKILAIKKQQDLVNQMKANNEQ